MECTLSPHVMCLMTTKNIVQAVIKILVKKKNKQVVSFYLKRMGSDCNFYDPLQE